MACFIRKYRSPMHLLLPIEHRLGPGMYVMGSVDLLLVIGSPFIVLSGRPMRRHASKNHPRNHKHGSRRHVRCSRSMFRRRPQPECPH